MQAIADAGGEARYLAVDVQDAEALARGIDPIREEWGPITRYVDLERCCRLVVTVNGEVSAGPVLRGAASAFGELLGTLIVYAIFVAPLQILLAMLSR